MSTDKIIASISNLTPQERADLIRALMDSDKSGHNPAKTKIESKSKDVIVSGELEPKKKKRRRKKNKSGHNSDTSGQEIIHHTTSAQNTPKHSTGDTVQINTGNFENKFDPNRIKARIETADQKVTSAIKSGEIEITPRDRGINFIESKCLKCGKVEMVHMAHVNKDIELGYIHSCNRCSNFRGRR